MEANMHRELACWSSYLCTCLVQHSKPGMSSFFHCTNLNDQKIALQLFQRFELNGINLNDQKVTLHQFEGFEFKIYPTPYYISLIYLSLLSASAFSIWYVLLNRPNIKISFLNIWKFIIPVSGAALSWLLLPDESPETITIIGMLIICFSLILLNLNDGLKRFAFYFRS
jgi:hypothetical protein